MKKNKAFTLIELLAIIVILAIIAVITVPIILNVIENSKKGAVKNSAYGYKDSINKYYISKMITEPNYKIDGKYIINEEGNLIKENEIIEIQVSGNKPTGGELTYELQKIVSGCLTINEYKVFWNDNEVKKIEKGTCYEQTTITFDSNGGSIVEPQTKNIDKKIGNLPQPTKNNYALQGWFTEQTGGNQITEDTIVTGPQTYYAHWVQNAVSITFDSREGSAVPSTTVEINHSYNQDHTELPTPTRAGYNFQGWSETQEGTTITGNETLTTDKIYYAQWRKMSPLIYTDTNNDSQISVGDMVTISDEGFEVINPNKNGNVVLLAEYNLKQQPVNNTIGYKNINNGMLLAINKSYQTFLADNDMVWKQYNAAWNATDTSYKTGFSYDVYWYIAKKCNGYCDEIPGGSTYNRPPCENKCQYGYDQNYDTDSQGKKYIYKTSNGYNTYNNIYYIINTYKAYLQNLGQNIADIRLMSYAEAYGLSSSQKLTHNQSYWLGSVNDNGSDYGHVWSVEDGGNYGVDIRLVYHKHDIDYYNHALGIRAVIEISTAEFQQ
jgi:uncharacterized repeat protein (TIGR02543 family)